MAVVVRQCDKVNPLPSNDAANNGNWSFFFCIDGDFTLITSFNRECS